MATNNKKKEAAAPAVDEEADTAAVALLACWQALAGDWTAGGEDRRPPFRG